ncbi:MAG TPA: outer membrane beta-barrel protein [Planctomycetota bacterium]|jgi:opacity protein-like surface antigen|nr:outer membrane beta-barrel protein [Planctomycetota bacterium]
MLPIFLIPLVADATPPTIVDPFAWPAPIIVQESHTEKKSYLRLSGGLTTTEDSSGPDEDIKFNEGYLLGVAFGRRVGASDTGLGFCFELEGLWTDQDADDDGPIQAVSDVSVAALLLNGLLDFRIADAVGLYGGAGIGVAWLNVGTEADSLHEFNDEDGPFLAWQARAGVEFHLSGSTTLNVGYRFLNIDDANIDDDIGAASFDLQTQQHVLEVGISFGI